MSNSNVYAIALKDTSPMLAYSPYRDINSRTSGWMLVSQNPDTTAHWSTMSGASFSLDFYGSGIVIYGSANAGAFSTSLDSKVTPGAPSDSILYETQGLDVGKHTLTLSLSNSDGLNITSVSVASAVGKSESTVVQVIRDTVHAINGAPVADSFFQTSGGTWIPHLDSYYRLDTTSVGGTLSFSFSHTSGIILYGSTNYDHSLFSVTMNPTAGATTSQRTFNATNSLLSYDSVLFFESGMVSSTTYTVRLENLASETYFELYSAHLLQTVEGSSDNGNSTLGLRGPNSHGLGTAPIVGIAVRCAVLLALLAIIAVLFWKRQQTQTTGKIVLDRQQATVRNQPTLAPIIPVSTTCMANQPSQYVEASSLPSLPPETRLTEKAAIHNLPRQVLSGGPAASPSMPLLGWGNYCLLSTNHNGRHISELQSNPAWSAGELQT